MRRHPIARASGQIDALARDDIHIVSVSPTGELLLQWRGGTVALKVPATLAHYYQRLVRPGG